MHTKSPRESARAAAGNLRRHPWLTLLGAFLLGLAILILLWDWNWFKGPVERQVEARTGREFDIGGNLDVDLDWRTPTIRADRVRFGNAKWSKEPTMAAADRVEFRIAIWPLLRRQVRIPELRLTRPSLHLEMGPQRIGNWKFGKGGGTRTQFRQLWIDGGKLTFVDAAARTDIAANVTSQRTNAVAGSSVAVEGGGRWKGNRFRIEGTA